VESCPGVALQNGLGVEEYAPAHCTSTQQSYERSFFVSALGEIVLDYLDESVPFTSLAGWLAHDAEWFTA
jgi:hypothetical protein